MRARWRRPSADTSGPVHEARACACAARSAAMSATVRRDVLAVLSRTACGGRAASRRCSPGRRRPAPVGSTTESSTRRSTCCGYLRGVGERDLGPVGDAEQGDLAPPRRLRAPPRCPRPSHGSCRRRGVAPSVCAHAAARSACPERRARDRDSRAAGSAARRTCRCRAGRSTTRSRLRQPDEERAGPVDQIRRGCLSRAARERRSARPARRSARLQALDVEVQRPGHRARAVERHGQLRTLRPRSRGRTA